MNIILNKEQTPHHLIIVMIVCIINIIIPHNYCVSSSLLVLVLISYFKYEVYHYYGMDYQCILQSKLCVANEQFSLILISIQVCKV